jgi:hypothetical protein
MRRAICVLAAVIAVSALAEVGHAQAVNNPGGFSDPFFLYYGWYLPQQNALANQPRIEDTINYNVGQNQVYAQTNRAGLYDPNGGYGRFDPNPSGDPFDPSMRAGGGMGRVGMGRMRGTVPTSNANGSGPPMYFNRASQYYPSMRSGRGPNRNLAVVTRGARRGGGPSMGAGMGGGMGGGMGMPGPR